MLNPPNSTTIDRRLLTIEYAPNSSISTFLAINRDTNRDSEPPKANARNIIVLSCNRLLLLFIMSSSPKTLPLASCYQFWSNEYQTLTHANELPGLRTHGIVETQNGSPKSSDSKPNLTKENHALIFEITIA